MPASTAVFPLPAHGALDPEKDLRQARRDLLRARRLRRRARARAGARLPASAWRQRRHARRIARLRARGRARIDAAMEKLRDLPGDPGALALLLDLDDPVRIRGYLAMQRDFDTGPDAKPDRFLTGRHLRYRANAEFYDAAVRAFRESRFECVAAVRDDPRLKISRCDEILLQIAVVQACDNDLRHFDWLVAQMGARGFLEAAVRAAPLTRLHLSHELPPADSNLLANDLIETCHPTLANAMAGLLRVAPAPGAAGAPGPRGATDSLERRLERLLFDAGRQGHTKTLTVFLLAGCGEPTVARLAGEADLPEEVHRIAALAASQHGRLEMRRTTFEAEAVLAGAPSPAFAAAIRDRRGMSATPLTASSVDAILSGMG